MTLTNSLIAETKAVQTNLAPQYAKTNQGKLAERILRSCVHCGFCSATCPTYLNTGNELNSPRGRIYLIKQIVEGQAVTKTTLEHLNLCLQCRNCESTCPSGVEYGKLYEIGQDILKKSTPNNRLTRLKYWVFTKTLPYPLRFSLIFFSFKLVKPFLPKRLKTTFKNTKTVDPLPKPKQVKQQVILFKGCVQRVLAPEINQSIENLLHKTQTTAIHCSKEKCCGAIDWHAGNKKAALKKMKSNIELWTNEDKPLLVTGSGCSAFIKQYAEHLENDETDAQKAKTLLKNTFDTVDYFNLEKLKTLNIKPTKEKIACHTPCSLQHWQKNPNTLESNLKSLGFNLVETNNPHLCCGSAGLYSSMNPKLSTKIKNNKVTDLQINQPNKIVSNNIGCINHLHADLNAPIQHWCELIDEASQL